MFRSDFIEDLLGTQGQHQDVSVEMELKNQYTSVKHSQQVYLGRAHWFRVSEGLGLKLSPRDWTRRPQGAICLQPEPEQEGGRLVTVSRTAVTTFGLKLSAAMNS